MDEKEQYTIASWMQRTSDPFIINSLNTENLPMLLIYKKDIVTNNNLPMLKRMRGLDKYVTFYLIFWNIK